MKVSNATTHIQLTCPRLQFLMFYFIFLNLGQSYKHLMKMISCVELSDEQKLKFSQALHGFYPLTDVLGEVAAEFKLENKLNLVSLR